MPRADLPMIAYVVKMYPRFSETFVVNEILGHEAAGTAIEIFALRHPVDPRFHPTLAEVRAPVTWLSGSRARAEDVWALLGAAHAELPALDDCLGDLLAAGARDAYQAVELALAVRARGIGHLHAHFGSAPATVARLASRLAGVPYSFTAHAKDIFHESVNDADLRDKLLAATSVVTVSDFNLDHLRARFDTAADRVRRVYNGLDLQLFPYDEPGDRPPVIVSVGRLVEKKGMDVLVDACGLLAERGRTFECRIAGAGPLEEELRLQIARLGLAERVHLCGPQPQQRVRELVASAAAFAAPCVVGHDGNRDGLPTALLEAMAVGTPCVSTNVTGIPEVLRDGETGLLVAQRDAEGLAAALEVLLDDTELRTALAKQARSRVEEDFDLHRQAARMRAVILAPPTEAREVA